MKPKPSYEELIKKVRLLEREADKRRRIEAQLKVSEGRFRDIAENALEWIWEIDSTGRYTYSSPVVKSVLGYEPNEVVGKFFYDFFHPDEKEEERAKYFLKEQTLSQIYQSECSQRWQTGGSAYQWRSPV
jgi:PAS domain S-box-containing protein